MAAPRIHLVLDFDGTITIEDTTAIIGRRCIAKARELANPELTSELLPKDMSYYSDLYFQQYQEWKQSSASAAPARTTVDEEVSYLSKSREIERDSFLRVRNAVLGVPGSISNFEHDRSLRDDFMIRAGRDAVRAGEVTIRDPQALKSLLAKVSSAGNRWGIVSVSWSRAFIVGVLAASGLVVESDIAAFADKIKANELLAPMAPSGRDGDGIICSASDKQQTLAELLTEWDNGPETENAVTMYVGDSTTDLGCLVHAQLGFHICEDRTNSSVVKTLERLHNDCVDLNERRPTLNVDTAAERTVYLVTGFKEIHEWLTNAARR